MKKGRTKSLETPEPHFDGIEQHESGALFKLAGRLRKEMAIRAKENARPLSEVIKGYEKMPYPDLTIELNDDDHVEILIIRSFVPEEWTMSPDDDEYAYNPMQEAQNEVNEEMTSLVAETCFKECSISVSCKNETLLAARYTAPADHPKVREHTRIIYLRALMGRPRRIR